MNNDARGWQLPTFRCHTVTPGDRGTTAELGSGFDGAAGDPGQAIGWTINPPSAIAKYGGGGGVKTGWLGLHAGFCGLLRRDQRDNEHVVGYIDPHTHAGKLLVNLAENWTNARRTASL